MTTFLDGPAADVTLFLKRAPMYIRVAVDSDGTFDALDQVGDTPKTSEKLVAYERFGEVGSIHICRSKQHGSGWFTVAHYRVLEDQPEDSLMQRTSEWRAWCVAKRDSKYPNIRAFPSSST